MWPAKQIARFVNGCDKYGFPGEGRTAYDVAFYTGLYTALEVMVLAIAGVWLLIALFDAL